MAELPILYSFRRCPYAMRARMGLWNAKLKYIHREVNLKDKPKALLEVSPKGTVPVLVLPNGQVIEESLDILKWAFAQHNDENWALEMGEHQEAMDSIVNELDSSFKKNLDQYKYPERHQLVDGTEAREKGVKFLEKLDARLAKSDYLFGDTPSYVDVAVFPFIRQFSKVDESWFQQTPYMHLQQWLKKWIDSKCLVDVMEKYDFWIDESSEEKVVELNSWND